MEKDNIISNILIKKQLESKIKQLLIEIGIKPHIKGFKYWTTAILYAIEQESKGEELGKFMELYRYIGKKHKSTIYKVERDMRYAHQELSLKEVFNVPYSINNTAFLFLIKEKILSENNVFC